MGQRNVIYRGHNDNQLIEVIDSGDVRSLYFSGNVLQSAIFLSKPQSLALSYTRFMLAPLLFNDAPEKILIVGLGAGSLLHFLYHYFPESSIDAIDSSAHIIELAREHFSLPQTPEISVHCCDGYDFLADLPGSHGYDLILVDAFDADGMAPSIYRAGFFELCRFHLQASGLISLNLWSGNAGRLVEVKEDLAATFGSVIKLPVPKRGNVICLAGNEADIWQLVKRSRAELDQLKSRFEINFKPIVNSCLKNNLTIAQRFSHALGEPFKSYS